MARGHCIWCRKETSDIDVEHVFPEALGCPAHLTLPGNVVCKRCNNGLAHLDQAVADDFDLLRVMHGVKRKGGRYPEVNSRGNVYATQTDGGPNLFFNMDSIAHVTPTGQRLAPYRGSKRDLKPRFETDGRMAATEVEVPFGRDNKFARGLYKIALNGLALGQGADFVLAPRFDWLREYVTHGGPRRRILLTKATTDDYMLVVGKPSNNEAGHYAVEVRIAMASFLLDLSQDEALLPEFAAKAKELWGDTGYSVLPPLP